MCLRVAVLLAVLSHFFSSISQANEQAARVFSEGYIEGLYGRFFEYTEDGASSPCPRVIDHFNRGFLSALGNSWTIPHSSIAQNGIKCNDRNVLVLNSFNFASNTPDRIKSNHIAVETFAHMKRDSSGFWMGADARTCGKWVFPNPSFIFFVKEFDRAITTSFRLRLQAGQKYMFVVAPKFTCIFLDLPRTSPNPNVVLTPGNGSKPSEGTNVTEQKPSSDSAIDSPAEDSIDNEVPSKPPESTGDADPSDTNLTITDIQIGATPKPTKTPWPGTIQGILEDEDDDHPVTAILNEEHSSEETSDIDDTNDFFDETVQAGDSLCFPGSATVELKNGRTISMDHLSIGDEVRVGEGYSRVFGFTHRDPYIKQIFMRLTTRCGHSITLTAGHYLYANDQLVPAKDVRLGDKLRLVTGNGTVERMETVVRNGLYNPHTIVGVVVVNGVVTSCYTTAVSTWSAHAILTPFRAVWQVYPVRLLSFLETRSLNDELAQWRG